MWRGSVRYEGEDKQTDERGLLWQVENHRKWEAEA